MNEEVLKKLEKIGEGIVKAQEVADRNEKAIDALDKIHLKKITEDASKSAEDLQILKQKANAQEEAHKLLEKAVYRMPNAAQGASEIDVKARDEFLRFLRRGEKLSEELVETICDEIARKTLLGAKDDDINYYRKSLVAGVDPQGGYWIRPELSSRIITRIFETSPVRLVASVVNTSSDVLDMIIDDNEATDGGWVGETEERSDTGTPDIGVESIPVHEIYAQPLATRRMLDNAGFDIEAYLMNKITTKISRSENTSFVTGNGSKKAKGFLAYSAWSSPGVYQRNAIEQVNSGSASDFTGDGVIKLQNSLIEDYQANAVWMLKRASFENIMILKDGVGRYLLNPNTLIEYKEMVLRGRKVIFANDMPAIAGDALPLIYGDFSVGYTIVDRIGFRMLRDELTKKPYIRFYTTKFVGGAVTNFESLKIQKIAA